METQTIERDDTSSTKPGDTIQHHENEKELIESPVESISPAPEHVTAKTWIVILVSFCLAIYGELQLMALRILSSTFGLSFWPVPTTAAMQSILSVKFGDPTSTYWMSTLISSPESSRLIE
jgi:hypothetical protein